VDAALESFRSVHEFSEKALLRHLEAAQDAIVKAKHVQPDLSSMRTTIVLLLADSRRALWAHVGDSRLYCLEHGRIAFCTSDHSVVQMMVKAGELSPEAARHHEDRNRLLRCLGNGEESELRPTILPEPYPLRRGAAFLLCTDGFWQDVSDKEMEADFSHAASSAAWLAAMEVRLRRRLRENSDNYTAMAITYDSNAEGQPIMEKSRVGETTKWLMVLIWIVALSAFAIAMFYGGLRFSEMQRQVIDLERDKASLRGKLDGVTQLNADLQIEVAKLKKNRPADGPAKVEKTGRANKGPAKKPANH
jgi:serine/threonine protein phosphatase PrpC